jgi:hypothetical protein
VGGFSEKGRSKVMSISVKRGKTTSRPWRVTMKTPEAQIAAIRAVPAVKASVAKQANSGRIRSGLDCIVELVTSGERREIPVS